MKEAPPDTKHSQSLGWRSISRPKSVNGFQDNSNLSRNRTKSNGRIQSNSPFRYYSLSFWYSLIKILASFTIPTKTIHPETTKFDCHSPIFGQKNSSKWTPIRTTNLSKPQLILIVFQNRPKRSLLPSLQSPQSTQKQPRIPQLACLKVYKSPKTAGQHPIKDLTGLGFYFQSAQKRNLNIPLAVSPT